MQAWILQSISTSIWLGEHPSIFTLMDKSFFCMVLRLDNPLLTLLPATPQQPPVLSSPSFSTQLDDPLLLSSTLLCSKSSSY